MHITQVVSLINIRLGITVCRKWALRLKILILYSQKFHTTKFLSSENGETGHFSDPVSG